MKINQTYRGDLILKRLRVLIALICLWPISSEAVIPASVSLEPSDSGFASNTVIAIESHNGEIWLATSRGANVTSDSGFTWVLIQDAPGMLSTNVSALHSQSEINGPDTTYQMWMATSHEEQFGDGNVSISDGLFYSDDDGGTWTQVNFGEDGLDIPYIWGASQTIFDITGYTHQLTGDGWMFFAAFAGGLVASRDNGEGWRRIYHSTGDSIQYNDPLQVPSFRNRYFSAVADSSHGDTVMVWSGTASGVIQYIFAPEREKLFASEIRAVAGCDLCLDSASNYLYIGTDLGVSRTLRTGGPFISRFAADGLPGQLVTALYDFRDVLFVGTADAVSGNSTGLAISTDYGNSFDSVSLAEVTGMDKKIVSFETIGERLYLAAETAGLFVTSDTGASWQRILIDSANVASPLNSVYDMDAIDDTLYVGTDSGVVRLNLATDGAILARFSYFYIEDVWSSQGIRALEVHQFFDTSGTTVDSTDIWTVNIPTTLAGTFSVIRGRLLNPPAINGSDTTYLIRYEYLPDTIALDVGFIGDTLYVVGEFGVRSNSAPNSENLVSGPSIAVSLVDTSAGILILFDTVSVMENLDGLAVFGTSNSLAVRKDSTHNYRITRGNIDSLGRDVAVNYTFLNTIYVDNDIVKAGLPGDFIPALGIQYLTSGPARIWASGRPTINGWNGISVGLFEMSYDELGNETGIQLKWYNVYDQDFAWNFAFDGDSVTYAATNSGLLVNRWDISTLGDSIVVWDTLTIINDDGLELLGPGMSVFSVAVVDDNLWVGTGDGTIRLSLIDENDRDLFIVVDSTTSDNEVYAFPVPFSPGRGEEVHFRFVLKSAADVTIEIYDFAMNLVARPIDGTPFPAGYHESPGSPRLTWDGYNGKGDLVAVGVYYFKVIYSTGEERWGKLAVLP